jgi:TonB-dependent receptor
MKNLLTLFLLVMLCHGMSGQSGNIRGTITDENGLGLPGANVHFENQSWAVPSDVNGEYVMMNIPEGDYVLIISYIGYESISKPISVTTGNTSILNFTLTPGVLIGEEVIVVGDRIKGQAKAINQQKQNTNITNIVAADQIGRFPDANIGDALKRIPGITMQGDQGEARNILIRGFAPQLNAVRLNGERIPSAEGDNRNVQLDLIPSDMIQTIEVNKAVTPDMEADAIGGAVNLVTRAAPGALRLSGTLASGVNLLTNKPIWTGSLIAGDRFANDKLGVILSASVNDHVFGSQNIEPSWANEVESPITEEDIEVTPFIEEIEIRDYEVRRLRQSYSLGLDYRLNPNHTLYVQGIYNTRNDWENRFGLVYSDLEPLFEDGTENIIGYEGESARQLKGGDAAAKNSRLEEQRSKIFSLRGDHLFGKLGLDWQATYADASEKKPNERYLTYALDDVIPVTMDVSDPMFPNITPVNAGDIDPGNYELDELTEENGDTKEADFNLRADFNLPILFNDNRGLFKFGGRLKLKNKDRNNNFFEYGALTDDYETLSAIPTTDRTDPDFLPGSQYVLGSFQTPEFMGGLDLKNPALFEEEDLPGEYLPGNYKANETITAGYLMVDQKLNDKLTLIAGVRIENTNIEYTGNEVLDEEELIAEVTAKDQYTNVLPGINLRYAFSDNLVLRASWTNTLSRPNYYDLVPYRNIIEEDEEISAGNANLEPITSTNYDVNLEKYFASVGLISGGVFYKRVNDFIYTFVNEEYVDDDITGGEEWTFFQPLNGGTANVYGFECAFQRQLDFLPGALKGLGIYLNYTYTGSSADGIRNGDGDPREGLDLPGAVPHLFNASLSFETKKLVVRISGNYAHDYLDEVGDNAFTDRYYDRQFFLDANASYAFTPNLRFFAEGNNLTNQPLRYYQGIRDRTQQLEYYNARFNFGIKFDLFGSQD